MKIIFFGTPSIAANLLKYLLDKKCSIEAIVTMPDRPTGRKKQLTPSDVKVFSKKHAPLIPLYQPEQASSPDFVDILKKHQADLFIVVAFGQIFKENLLRLPCVGCINVHFSLLPKYRGAAPLQRCVMEGEVETGVSIMHMVKALDEGDVIKVAKLPVGQDHTHGELEQLIIPVAQELLLQSIHDLKLGRAEGVVQDAGLATYAKKIESKDCEMHLDQEAQDVYNVFRAVTPKPGAWCWVRFKGEKKRLKVQKATLLKDINMTPKAIAFYDLDTGIVVACKNGALRLDQLQLEGKKTMSFLEFLKGHVKEDLSFM